MTTGRVLAAVAAALTFIIFSQTASAQYPPPKGSLVCALAQSRVVINSSIYFQVRLIDTSGQPMPGQNVYFNINSSNGSARLSPTSGITDGNGQTSTTIIVGANPGNIEVTATSDSVACRAALVVNNPCDYAPGSSACCDYNSNYPGCVRSVTIIQPPSTGDAGLIGSVKDETQLSLYALGALEIVVLLGLSTWLVSSQIRERSNI